MFVVLMGACMSVPEEPEPTGPSFALIGTADIRADMERLVDELEEVCPNARARPSAKELSVAATTATPLVNHVADFQATYPGDPDASTVGRAGDIASDVIAATHATRLPCDALADLIAEGYDVLEDLDPA